ncbi:hypothetical protein HOG16_02665 [Candidatus Woesearchaeota archaeon]|jgi:hypothetical protein|nr:hypothetical protein [Candidatus Woesearchaeota archaeon]MBT4322000.1 hypothetical protein [Candidatus Woesearchaeota archaeon]MBT4630746.1 hypothetical protein [Candidatus Woesearchaeota archaeon]
MVNNYLKNIGKAVLPLVLAASLGGAVSSKAEIPGYWFKEKGTKIEARGKMNDQGTRLIYDKTGEGEFYPLDADSTQVGFGGGFGNLEDIYLNNVKFENGSAIFQLPYNLKGIDFRCSGSSLTSSPKESYTWQKDLHLLREQNHDYSFSDLGEVVEFLGNTSQAPYVTNMIEYDIQDYLGGLECTEELKESLSDPTYNQDLFDLIHFYTYGGNEE